MEVRLSALSEALPLDRVLKNNPVPGMGQRAEKEAPLIFAMPSRNEVPDPLKDEGEKLSQLFDKAEVKDLMKKSAELLSTFDRELKYELKEEAGVVQIQVIDSSDGRVVRKIPADEVLKLLEQMKSQIDDRFEVRA